MDILELFNINLIDLAIIGIIILAMLITILIFLKLGRPSNWFKSEPSDPKQLIDSVMSQGEAQ